MDETNHRTAACSGDITLNKVLVPMTTFLELLTVASSMLFQHHACTFLQHLFFHPSLGKQSHSHFTYAAKTEYPAFVQTFRGREYELQEWFWCLNLT